MNVRTHAHDLSTAHAAWRFFPARHPALDRCREISAVPALAGCCWLRCWPPLRRTPITRWPHVVVFCEPTAARGRQWGIVARADRIKVRVFTSPTPALLEQIAHHARDDVIIGEGDAEADAAADQHLIKRETSNASRAMISSSRRFPAAQIVPIVGHPSRQIGSSRRQKIDCGRRSVGGKSRRR